MTVGRIHLGDEQRCRQRDILENGGCRGCQVRVRGVGRLGFGEQDRREGLGFKVEGCREGLVGELGSLKSSGNTSLVLIFQVGL